MKPQSKEKSVSKNNLGAPVSQFPKNLNFNENFFSVIQATIFDGIVISDLEGKIIYINRAGRELLAVKKDIIDVNRKDLITNQEKYLSGRLEYLFDPFQTFKKVTQGGLFTHLILKVHAADEKILDASYSPLYDQEGKIVAVLADFRDVTLLVKQQEEIVRQLSLSNSRRKRWDALFDNVEEGICVLDINGKIMEFNPTLELMTGYLEKEAVGKKYYELFKCHDTKGSLYGDSLLKKVQITGESIPYEEHLHTNRDGEEKWVATSLMPLTGETGEYECLNVIRDISNYKQVEKLKSDFVSIASHELRTPLTIVNGYLSLLTSGDLGSLTAVEGAQKRSEILKKVYIETRRLSSLVEDLLNISRIEEGRLRVNLEKTNIISLVKAATADYQPLAESKNLDLTYVGSELPLMVMADSGKLHQVLTNLIDNAIKYTEKGGVQVDVFAENGEIITQVTDTGVGVSPNLREIIFEKFQQAPGSYLKENKGTGLGLFIVKGILELHGGRIWVENGNPGGSIFRFALPQVR